MRKKKVRKNKTDTSRRNNREMRKKNLNAYTSRDAVNKKNTHNMYKMGLFVLKK